MYERVSLVSACPRESEKHRDREAFIHTDRDLERERELKMIMRNIIIRERLEVGKVLRRLM